MKKKIRWKLLGSLRVFQCCLDSSFGFIFKRNNISIAILLILFSLAICNVDARTNQPVNYQESKKSSTFDSTEMDGALSLQNGTSVIRDQNLFRIDCRKLHVGQFFCPEPTINPETQQPIGCTANNFAPINCTLRDGLICDNDTEVYKDLSDFKRYVQLAIPCQHTNGYSYEITLLLSIFFGMFGLDRFYLGYPGIGLLKFCTLGFLFIGQFIDIILIAMQIVRPADGSYYIIKHFGPKLLIRNAPYLEEVLPKLKTSLIYESSYELYYYPDRLSG